MNDEYDGYGIDAFHAKHDMEEADADDRESGFDEDGLEGLTDQVMGLDDFKKDIVNPSALNPKSVRERIDESLEILGDLKSRSGKVSRADLLNTLAKDLSEYYGYLPELSTFLLDLFSPAECVEYMDASDRPRPLVIRANTLKTTRKDLMEALTKRGANVEVVDWSKVAIKVTESSVPIGATPEYLGGHYMLQSAASMNPVLALAPQPNERVLDMSAAPGGKTSYISQLMKNSGLVIANDLKPQRQKATVANLHRLGVKNAIVCCYDGRKIPTIMKGFDRVLLDAPCSGLGVISRDPSVKVQRTLKDIQRIAHLQKELLVAAVDAVDSKSSSGGVVVYSTCSISVEENEQVIDYILSKRYVRLIDTGLTVGKPGFTRYQQKRFHNSMALTRRFYPHVHNMDGFFVAKLQKYENGPRTTDDDDQDENGITDQDEEEMDCLPDEYSNNEKSNQKRNEKTNKKRKNRKTQSDETHEDEAIPELVPIDEEQEGVATRSIKKQETKLETKQRGKQGGKNSKKKDTSKKDATEKDVTEKKPTKKATNKSDQSKDEAREKAIDIVKQPATNTKDEEEKIENVHVDQEIEFNIKKKPKTETKAIALKKKSTKRLSIRDIRKIASSKS